MRWCIIARMFNSEFRNTQEVILMCQNLTLPSKYEVCDMKTVTEAYEIIYS